MDEPSIIEPWTHKESCLSWSGLYPYCLGGWSIKACPSHGPGICLRAWFLLEVTLIGMTTCMRNSQGCNVMIKFFLSCCQTTQQRCSRSQELWRSVASFPTTCHGLAWDWPVWAAWIPRHGPPGGRGLLHRISRQVAERIGPWKVHLAWSQYWRIPLRLLCIKVSRGNPFSSRHDETHKKTFCHTWTDSNGIDWSSCNLVACGAPGPGLPCGYPRDPTGLGVQDPVPSGRRTTGSVQNITVSNKAEESPAVEAAWSDSFHV